MLNKAVRFMLSVSEEELENKQKLLQYQIISVCFLFVSGLVVFITERISPNFFNYPYLTFSIDIENIVRFWPMFLYAAIMAYLSSIDLISTRLDGKILKLDIATSILAGIWEELGFRWLYICSSMIVIALFNWLFSTALGWFLGIVVILFGISMLFQIRKNLVTGLTGVLLMIVGYFIIRSFSHIDPIFWIWDHLTLPIVNFFTLGKFGNIFYNNDYPKLFIFGMVAANGKFRDGHKYQGIVGIVNSWIVGFILMGAMLNYGLGTAIAIHIIYDIEFDIIRYIFRKIDVV